MAMISIRTATGTLEIESDNPNVQVAVKQDGEVVEVVDAQCGWKIAMKAGQYELAPQGSNDGFQLDQNSITVRHGEVVKVELTVKRQASSPPADTGQAEAAKTYIPPRERLQETRPRATGSLPARPRNSPGIPPSASCATSSSATTAFT